MGCSPVVRATREAPPIFFASVSSNESVTGIVQGSPPDRCMSSITER